LGHELETGVCRSLLTHLEVQALHHRAEMTEEHRRRELRMADLDRVARDVVSAALPDMGIATAGQRETRDGASGCSKGEAVAGRACRVEHDHERLRASRARIRAFGDF